MLKASHWLGIVLGATTVLAAGLAASNWPTVRYFATNWHELSQGNDWARRLKTADDLVDYIAAHPRDVSLAFWKVGEEPSGIYHEADTVRPVASTAKILVLAAYAEAIRSGAVSGDEQISLDEWNALYLPTTDAGAHLGALSDLGRRGRLANEKVSLADLAFAMTRYSDNAAMDCLMQRIGRPAIANAISSLGLAETSRPHPFGGEMLSWRSADRSAADSSRRLGAMSSSDYVDLTWSLTAKLAHDADFRTKERARLESEGIGLTIVEQEGLGATYGNRGSAREYAKVMQAIYSNETQGMADKTWAMLEWPTPDPAVFAKFAILGTKNGYLPGIVTSAYYARPKGAQTGRVLALFFQNVAMGVWSSMHKSLVHQELERRLLTDDVFVEKVRKRLQ